MAIIGIHPAITVNRRQFHHRYFRKEALDAIPILQRVRYGEVYEKHGIRFTGNSRLLCFQRSRVCCGCGVEGLFFIYESSEATSGWHPNLYGVKNGRPRLMTIDHIVPRFAGGSTELGNLVTMCERCNNKKGSRLPIGCTLYIVHDVWCAVMQYGNPVGALLDCDWGWKAFVMGSEVFARTKQELYHRIEGHIATIRRTNMPSNIRRAG